ncbi:MAG: HEPN domain-containing protein [Pyrobaculum sp.]
MVEAGALLDRYYVPSRYLNAWPSGSPSRRLTREDAERAVSAARTVLEYVRGVI